MMDPVSITMPRQVLRALSAQMCRVPNRCDDRPAARPNTEFIQQHSTPPYMQMHIT